MPTYKHYKFSADIINHVKTAQINIASSLFQCVSQVKRQKVVKPRLHGQNVPYRITGLLFLFKEMTSCNKLLLNSKSDIIGLYHH